MPREKKIAGLWTILAEMRRHSATRKNCGREQSRFAESLETNI